MKKFLIVALLSAVVLGGCQPKTDSILTEGKQVTAVELKREALTEKARLKGEMAVLESQAEALEAKLGVGAEDLDRQAAMIQAGLDVLGGLASTVAGGGFTAAGLVGSALHGALGIAAIGYAVKAKKAKANAGA